MLSVFIIQGGHIKELQDQCYSFKIPNTLIKSKRTCISNTFSRGSNTLNLGVSRDSGSEGTGGHTVDWWKRKDAVDNSRMCAGPLLWLSDILHYEHTVTFLKPLWKECRPTVNIWFKPGCLLNLIVQSSPLLSGNCTSSSSIFHFGTINLRIQ